MPRNRCVMVFSQLILLSLVTSTVWRAFLYALVSDFGNEISRNEKDVSYGAVIQLNYGVGESLLSVTSGTRCLGDFTGLEPSPAVRKSQELW
jgi:hypothetical protein